MAGGITKLRGRQTRANDIYNPHGDGLASDAEVENRVRKHSAMFHNNRNVVTKLIFDDDGNLTDIKSFSNDEEDVLFAHTEFTYTDLVLTNIDKKIYKQNSTELYTHLQKEFIFDGKILVKINNNKVV